MQFTFESDKEGVVPMTFQDYRGEVRSITRGRGATEATLELREALADSVTSGFKIIPGTTEADMKTWSNKIRTQAAKIDLGVAIRVAVTGEIAFKAHELEDGEEPVAVPSPPPPAVVPASPPRPKRPPVRAVAPAAPAPRRRGRQ